MGTEPLNTPATPPPAQDPATEYARTLRALTPGVWLVPGVLAVNVIVFVIMATSGVSPMEPTVDGLIQWGANFGPLTTGGQWWRLLTSMFVHIGLFHIGMNMFVLWDIGRFMERLLGRGGFLVMYLFAGLAGSLASLAWNPFVVSAGASGAIFGLYGGLFAYLARFGPDIPTQSLAGLQKGAVTFIGYNVVYGFLIQGIDISAHIGGLAGGFAIGLLLCHAPTAQAAGRRTALALRGAILGCAAVVAVALAVPPTPDLEAAAKRFDAVERQVIDAINAAAAEWRAAKLDDEAFANRLEKDVLSPWRAARESIAKLRGLPKLQQAFVTDLLRFADQRTVALELLAAGARAHDGEKVKQAWEILAPAPAARSGGADNGGRATEPFPARGKIIPASFPHLLVSLYRHGATGSLKVTGPVHAKALYFREGRIFFGSSNDPRDQLGAILIEGGHMGREDAAREQVERILADVLSWETGSFEFEEGVLPKGSVDLKLSTERLLLAAVQRIPDRSFVRRHVDMGTILERAPGGEATLSDVGGRADVWPLLESLDGHRSLKDAISLARLDEIKATKTACAMLFLGAVRKTTPSVTASGGGPERARRGNEGPPASSSSGPAATAGEWAAPERPDPKKVLEEARADVQAGRYEVALEKYLWFHRNALQFRRSLHGVRSSFALVAWFKLGAVYPPALAALRDTRDQALESFKREHTGDAFVDFVAINRTLGEEARTADAFEALDRDDPVTARQVFATARPALVKARDYTLCGKYLKPKEDLSLALHIYRMDRNAAKDERPGPEVGNFAEDRFTNETTTLIALLVVNGREGEAKDIARAVKSEWDAPAFHAAVEKAVAGVVPEPWP